MKARFTVSRSYKSFTGAVMFLVILFWQESGLVTFENGFKNKIIFFN